MSFFLLALSLLVLTALLSLLGRRANDLTIRAAPLGTMLASIAGLYPAVQVLASGQALTFYAPWSLPGAAFHLVIDPLAAFFLLPVFILSALAAIYGQAYLRVAAPQRSLGVATASFNLLLLAMVLVITAHNIMLFLLAWELMALVSFLLVMFEGAAPDVQKAGWTYLVAMHIGTVFVIVFFLLLGHHAASFDFNHFGPLKQLPLNLAGLAFILAWVGFGTKAGFVPMHVWLPEAHPAAPSHVSAVMSGVMIKTGIYGLLRALTFLPAPPAWWGWSLIISGLLSGLFGVLYALTQPDIKRLLAYHSVENIGIITLAIGCALLGFSYGSLPVAVLGLTGALLHVFNHAIFKGLLFLGAGAVVQAAQTRDLEQLGGLLKRLPQTGLFFLIGAVAIAGLPPLNGFVSEFLIYFSAFSAGGSLNAWPFVGVIAGLVLMGGLTAACFAKVFGIIFLGEPRSAAAARASEQALAMRWPMLILAAACVLLGLLSVPCVKALQPVVASILAQPEAQITAALFRPLFALTMIVLMTLIMALILIVLLLARRRWRRGRAHPAVLTWDCGYAAPNARMQYTASSFAQPFTTLFQPVLRSQHTAERPSGYFPAEIQFATETSDRFRSRLFHDLYRVTRWLLTKLHWLQHGRMQLYVLYIVITLIVLLIWHHWGGG